MLYHPPTGSTDPNAPYIGKNVAAGIQGSKVPPGAVEYTQREIVNAIALAGLSPTDTDLFQLARTIRGGQLDFDATDTGTADAVLCQVGLAHSAIKAGLPFAFIKGASDNSGAALTLTITDLNGNNGISGPLLKAKGGQPAKGDVPGGAIVTVRADASGAFRLLSAVLPSDVLALTAFFLGADTSTTANQVVLSSPNYPATLQVGRPFTFKVSVANTGATTIAINGTAPVPLQYRNAQALAPNELVVGDVPICVYDGTKVTITSTPRVQTLVFRSQPGASDIVQDNNAQTDYQTAPTGTLLGSFTVPAGYSNISVKANCYINALNATANTNVYMGIWSNANDGSGSSFRESQLVTVVKGQLVPLSRTAEFIMDPTKSYSWSCYLLKDTATGQPTPPSGNLSATAQRT